MKESESCTVIRDLLPLYVEQLTQEETNQVIEKHLQNCEHCNALYHSMKEELVKEQEQINKHRESIKELDYLKKIRTHSRKKVLFGIGGVLLVLAILILVNMFVYGTPSENYVADISVEDGVVKIKGTFYDSASVYSHHKIIEKNGQKQLVIYAAVASFWNRNGTFETECSLEKAKEQGLIVNDQKVTESGKIISIQAAEIYKKKHPYIGDMSKNDALANVVGIREELGSYTNELQTAKEPFGWTFYFQTILEKSNEKIFNEKMRAYAYVLLATVDNVDQITWSYMVKTTEGIEQKAVVFTTLEADGVLGESVKSFGESEDCIEELLVKVGLSQEGDGKSQLKEYQYRLTLKGRMPNAEKDSTFVVLTNNPNLTFDEVAKSLYSSNSEDWLIDTVIVSME